MASKRNSTRDVSKFALDTSMSMSHRIAAFLDWWAAQQPYDHAGYHEITKAVNAYKHLPRLDTKEVIQIQSVVSRTAKILQQQYGRTLIRSRGVGARASVDAEDAVRHNGVARARKVERDIVALKALDDIIDLKSMPDSPMKRWYQRDVRGILKQLSDGEYLQKLLPPKQDGDD